MIITYHPEILTGSGWSKFGYRKWSNFGCFFQAFHEPVHIGLYEFVKHSLSTQLYEEGYSLHDIQKFHGHSSPETSLIYTKIDVLKRFRNRGTVTEIKKAQNDQVGLFWWLATEKGIKLSNKIY